MYTCKCPDYQGVLIIKVSLSDKVAPLGTTNECMDYAGVLIKFPLRILKSLTLQEISLVVDM